MEALLVLLGLYLFAVLIILPVWTLIKISGLRDANETLRQRLANLEVTLSMLAQKATPPTPPPSPAPVTQTAAVADAFARPPDDLTAVPFRTVTIPRAASQPSTLPVPPPPPMTEPTPAAASIPPVDPPLLPPVFSGTPTTPPPPVIPTSPPAPPPLPPAPRPKFNWEQFMGAKLFAWLGGIALFLGVVYFVKLSFENGWISPELRVASGFLLGAGLMVGGLRLPRVRYAVLGQTLIAAGVVSLYAVTFAANSIYHFAFFGPLPTFLLMTLITATAFILAVRLEAQVVAILGILGGFLTPVLISTGHDNPPGLFGYLALLNIGLIAVALHRRWFYLVALGTLGTVLMMIGWAEKFYAVEKTVTAMVVCLGYSALFLGASETGRRLGRHQPLLSWCAAVFPLVGFGFAFYFLDYPAVSGRAGLYLGFIFLTDLALLALAWRDEEFPRIHLVAGLIAFALLSLWTANALSDELLPWALGAYLVFAALHTVFPLLLQRRHPDAQPTWWSQLFPPLTLLLLLFPIYRLDDVPFLIWPAILLIDVLAIALAAITASLTAVAAVLVLTLLATGMCVFKVPASFGFEPSLLLVIGAFAVFFFGACLWLVRQLGDRLPAARDGFSNVFGDTRAQLPAFASLLPFLLLIMACARLVIPDPSAVFGLGLLLVVLTLGLARLLMIAWLPLCALVGMAAVQYAWHARQFDAAEAGMPLVWYTTFYVVFALYPFLFRSAFSRLTGPWAVAALSGVAHFVMIYGALRTGWAAEVPGVIPALFCVAPLASLVVILRTMAADNPARLNQLAWFGGAALAFITLIFPIQFERQWLTVAWALEGAALLWLFHRVPHRGLRGVGTILLVVAFARLALNPAVFSYHVRGETPLLNWYLYAYSVAVASLFAGAHLLAPPRERVFGLTMPPIFHALAVILLFLLLNLEIADFFTAPGSSSLVFEFSGNFARDMSYTIGWALFALALLVVGIWRTSRGARFSAIALLGVALLKLFFHDLARLEALYRVGALFGVAVIAMLASFAYQRFLPNHDKTPPPSP